ncbi:MAG: asparagine synthase-related protein [Bacillota bacterium]|jgi:tRNA-specific 2-thiouridylase
MTKAVALLSGGLDSQLAIRLIQDQGIEVVGVNFSSPFFGESLWVEKAAQNLGIKVHTIHFGEEYLDLLKNPRYGFGKNLNPCIDCHGLMLKLAGQYMEEIGADFIITGEVLKQRPKSQKADAMRAVEKISGYSGLILRPLSARLLPPTLPEIRGVVDRERLLDISGRSRKTQIKLAQEYGIHEYPSPAGGCLLTVPNFAERLKSLLERYPEAGNDDFELLKVGRHFFGPNWFYLIVGRKESENQILYDKAGAQDILFKVASHPGPLSILHFPKTNQVTQLETIPGENIKLAAAITARYSDAKNLPLALIKYWTANDEPRFIEVASLDPSEVDDLLQK